MFSNNWICVFGVSRYVIHDRDVRFTTAFWKALWLVLGTKTLFRSIYYLQTDGQTDRQNYMIEQLVRARIYKGYNLAECLMLVELALNNIMAELSGMSPAHVMYG